MGLIADRIWPGGFPMVSIFPTQSSNFRAAPILITMLPRKGSVLSLRHLFPTHSLNRSSLLLSTRPSSTITPPPPHQFAHPGPLPLADKTAQKEFEESVKRAETELGPHPDAEKEPVVAQFEGDKNPVTGEIGGPKGKEPTRFGDWERKGRVYDF